MKERVALGDSLHRLSLIYWNSWVVALLWLGIRLLRDDRADFFIWLLTLCLLFDFLTWRNITWLGFIPSSFCLSDDLCYIRVCCEGHFLRCFCLAQNHWLHYFDHSGILRVSDGRLFVHFQRNIFLQSCKTWLVKHAFWVFFTFCLSRKWWLERRQSVLRPEMLLIRNRVQLFWCLTKAFFEVFY